MAQTKKVSSSSYTYNQYPAYYILDKKIASELRKTVAKILHSNTKTKTKK